MHNFGKDCPPHGPLGAATDYPQTYDPHQLFPIARPARIAGMYGFDVWNAYELSWLEPSGKPVVALGRFTFPCQSPCILESKSLKLYCNSLNFHVFSSWAEAQSTMKKDLSKACGAPVEVALMAMQHGEQLIEPEGLCVDDLPATGFSYEPDSSLLKLKSHAGSQKLFSRLLRSNCPVTNQPDWGTICVSLDGATLDPESFLRLIVSYRKHQDFHEACCERIFSAISALCPEAAVQVSAHYTRRGGLDINPFRTNRLLNKTPEGLVKRHTRQ